MNCQYGVQFYEIIVGADLQCNVKRKGNKGYKNMTGLLVIEHIPALRLKQHASHGLLKCPCDQKNIFLLFFSKLCY